MLNAYLDDSRVGPHNDDIGDGPTRNDWHTWVIVRSVDNLKVLLTNELVGNLALDHDMGLDKDGNLHSSGMDAAKWMCETNTFPKGDITIHSRNPVGATNIKSYLDSYFKVNADELLYIPTVTIL